MRVFYSKAFAHRNPKSREGGKKNKADTSGKIGATIDLIRCPIFRIPEERSVSLTEHVSK